MADWFTQNAPKKDEWFASNMPSLGKAEGIRGPLTPMETLGAILKTTARALPETGGMILGGMGGATVGGPLGAVAGAGTGAMAGKTLEQALRNVFPNIFGAPKSVRESLGEQGQAAIGGALAETGGQALSLLPATLARNVAPTTERIRRILEREKVPYTAGDIRPGGAAQISENLMRGTLLGGRIMQESDIQQAQALSAFKDRFMNSIGPIFSKEETGNIIKRSVETRADQLFSPGGLFDRAYSRVAELYAAPINTTAIRSRIQPIKDEVMKLVSEGRIPSASSPESPSKFLKLLDDLSNYGTNLAPDGISRAPVPLSYQDVWKDKQTIDSIIRSMGDDNLRTRAKATIKQVHTILDEAMEDAARQVSPRAAEQIRNINKGYAVAKKLLETESLVSDLSKMDPERIVARFFSAESITPEKDLLRAIPPNQKSRVLPIIRRRTLENLLAPATRTMTGTDIDVTSGILSHSRFQKAKEALKTLFTPEQMAGIEDFINASRMAQGSGTMVNPASGRQMLAASQVGTALQWSGGMLGVMAGRPASENAFYGGLTLFGPNIAARAITNPAIAKLLAKGFTMSPKAASASAWTPRALQILRIIEKQEQNVSDEQSQTQSRQ